ncbi:MAG: sugar phosphate nucleotidyltransferase [Bacteroidota bacterium]
MFEQRKHLWGIILAGGEGKRLECFVTKQYGRDCPKQYCCFVGTRSMLRHTIDRAEQFISSEQLLTVVTKQHDKCVQCQLSDRSAGTVIVQPLLRETGPAILYPLLHVDARDDNATVAIFPSDHFVLEEDRFIKYVQQANSYLQKNPQTVILLGVDPDAAESEYGWIEPGKKVNVLDNYQLFHIRQFTEKPDLQHADTISRHSVLWNTMVVVGRVKVLLSFFRILTPHLYRAFERVKNLLNTVREEDIVQQVYADLSSTNFSTEILSRNPEGLKVLRMPDVYWNDWGRPERIQSDITRFLLKVSVDPYHAAGMYSGTTERMNFTN